MKKFLFFSVFPILLIIIYPISIKANKILPDVKTGIVRGKVSEASTNKPMEFVSVSLYSLYDSVFINGTITNEKGEFKIEKISMGRYYLILSFMGFEKTYSMPFELSEKKAVINIGDLKLHEQSSQLKEVAITAERAKVEYQIDKRVINVDKDLVARGGSAVNVLENTPSIQVDPQGNVTLRGSSDFIVLVDGKQSILKGSDALKQINAASIQQIEVITNPSAKYEANAQSGIINVVLKKEKLQGLSGTIFGSKGFPDKNSANALINFRKSKINIFGGIDYENSRYENEISTNNISYLNSGTQFMKSKALQYFYSNNLSGKFGIDYDLNQKNAFSFQASYGEKGFDQGSDSKLYYYTNTIATETFSKSSNSLDVMGKVTEISLDFTHKFSDKENLTISNNYSSWDGEDNNLLYDNLSDLNYNDLKTIMMLKYRKYNFNYNYRLNIDYKLKSKIGNIEAGFQYRYEDRDDDLDFRDYDTASKYWIANPLFTSKLNYVNDIYSAYAQGKRI